MVPTVRPDETETEEQIASREKVYWAKQEENASALKSVDECIKETKKYIKEHESADPM